MDRKTIFITGAGSGIGRATALLFARQGWFTGLYDLNAESVLALQREIGADNSSARGLNVADAEDVKSALSHFLEATGNRIDVLFNCAGILCTGPFEEISFENHQCTIDVNARGILNCTYQAFPALKATPSSRVINMCSASAIYGAPDHAVYSATKFWVRGFTEALNIEWERFGIRVSDIIAPYVKTPMIDHARKIPAMKKLGVGMSPGKVAKTVMKAARGNRTHYVIGSQTLSLFYAARVFPTFLVRFVARKSTGY